MIKRIKLRYVYFSFYWDILEFLRPWKTPYSNMLTGKCVVLFMLADLCPGFRISMLESFRFTLLPWFHFWWYHKWKGESHFLFQETLNFSETTFYCHGSKNCCYSLMTHFMECTLNGLMMSKYCYNSSWICKFWGKEESRGLRIRRKEGKV